MHGERRPWVCCPCCLKDRLSCCGIFYPWLLAGSGGAGKLYCPRHCLARVRHISSSFRTQDAGTTQRRMMIFILLIIIFGRDVKDINKAQGTSLCYAFSDADLDLMYVRVLFRLMLFVLIHRAKCYSMHTCRVSVLHQKTFLCIDLMVVLYVLGLGQTSECHIQLLTAHSSALPLPIRKPPPRGFSSVALGRRERLSRMWPKMSWAVSMRRLANVQVFVFCGILTSCLCIFLLQCDQVDNIEGTRLEISTVMAAGSWRGMAEKFPYRDSIIFRRRLRCAIALWLRL